MKSQMTEEELHAELKGARVQEALTQASHEAKIYRLRTSLKNLITIVELYHREMGDCDHGVGICICGEKRDLENARELLGGL